MGRTGRKWGIRSAGSGISDGIRCELGDGLLCLHDALDKLMQLLTKLLVLLEQVLRLLFCGVEFSGFITQLGTQFSVEGNRDRGHRGRRFDSVRVWHKFRSHDHVLISVRSSLGDEVLRILLKKLELAHFFLRTQI